MGYKKLRYGTRILTADPRARYCDVHVFLGGTGAVGGTALLKMLAIYEDMMAVHPPRPEEVPILIATGRTKLERRIFTDRLFHYVRSRYGASVDPQPVRHGYLTHSGVFIVLEPFDLRALPGLESFEDSESDAQRRDKVAQYLGSIGTSIDDPAEDVVAALSTRIRSMHPMTDFLTRYRDEHLGSRKNFRYRCVFNGIPLPSFLSYPRDIDLACQSIGCIRPEHVELLKESLVRTIRDDLGTVQSELAENVIVAHTTSVGGMYDEWTDGNEIRRGIRLGFAHSAKDEALIHKQHFAEELTEQYGRIGVKVLITAAAIGVDEVRVRKTVPLHSALKRQLQIARDQKAELYEESVSSPVVPVLQPKTLALDGGPSEPIRFKRQRDVDDLRPTYVLRSGENGFFSVANAEALYRVMRVASTGELGLMLAQVGLFGDDPQAPWFNRNICYYTETDNARQVFEFLGQPMLRESQLSALDPLALQDLGSAKHQGELHTLGMLILIHRLQTLDVDAIPPYVELERFDAREFFESHSSPLTLDDVDSWTVEDVARRLRILATAESAADLEPLAPFRPHGHDNLFPNKVAARTKVLDLVLRAMWSIPSLGTPVVYESDGQTRMRCGPFLAPVETVLRRTDSFDAWLREQHQKSGNPCSFEEYRDFHLCNGGFIDIRPHAMVCTAKNDRTDLRGKIQYARNDEELRAALASIEPYSYFTTCGVVAVLFRLKAFYSMFTEADWQLGTLQETQWQMPRDLNGHLLLVPGVAEAMRMVAEGLEKTTGTERLDGIWAYERRGIRDRRAEILQRR